MYRTLRILLCIFVEIMRDYFLKLTKNPYINLDGRRM